MPHHRRPPLPLAALAVLLAACGGDGILVPRAPDFAVTPSLLSLGPGDTARLAPQLDLRPARGVQFLSRGTVATVTAGGLVSALVPGEGAVTVVAPNAGVIYTVPVLVRGVRVRVAGEDAPATTLVPGRASVATAAVFGLPAGADSGVRWSSSDTAVVQVAADGTVQPRLIGRATLAAASVANPFLRGTVTVDVSPGGRRPALSVELRTPDGGSLPEGGSVRGTMTAVVRAAPGVFPAGARVELWLGMQQVATRALGDGTVRVAIPTDARDGATGQPRYPDGTRALLVRVLARDGTTLGRHERPVVIANAGE